MSLESRTRRTSNEIISNKEPGPFVARVVSHLDKTYMGALEVELLKSNYSGDEANEKAQTVIVRYASPFYGVTPLQNINNEDGYRFTQQSYGFWAVPPDVGTKVLVIFAEGDRSQGYWIACIPDDYMNFMVPDGRASTELTTEGTPSQLKNAKLPVGEYSKARPQEGNDPTRFKKPYNKDFTEILEVQGLIFDETRGTTTSSARRETPSSVFGMNTPGPLDKRKNNHTGSRGVRGGEVKSPTSRLGGSSFVMDDGDDKLIRATHPADGPPFYINKEAGEAGGDETIPHNELIRIRTRTGHQILLHNSEDLIYIANSRGTAWIELTSDGKIDVHAQDSISLFTNQDFNLTAMRDINMEAGRNVNMRAAARWSDEQPTRNGIRSGQIHIESFFDTNITTGQGGGTLSLNTSRNWELNVEGEIKLTASKDIHLQAGSSIYEKADGSIHQTAKRSFYRKSFSNMYDLISGTLYTQASGPINVSSGADIFTSATGDMHLTGTNMFTSASGTLSINSGGALAVDGSTIDLNSGSSSAATPATLGVQGNSATPPTPAVKIAKLPKLILPYVFPGASQPVPYETIVPRAPQHEPWTHHENINPLAFKPEQTDREMPGELPSTDRILTPDTFIKSGGRTSSVVIPGSGGAGLGNEGSFETARNSYSGQAVPYDGSSPVVTVGDFSFSQTQDGPLATIKTKRKGLTTQIAEVFKDNFQGFIDELEDAGYTINSLGGYNRRMSTSGGSWSYHASGAAIDINPPNPVINGSPNGYFSPRPPNAPITDMPVATVRSLCKKYGLGWGGDWRSLDDAMHFSTAKAEGGSYNIPRNGRVPIPHNLTPNTGAAYVTTPNEDDVLENDEAIKENSAANRPGPQ